MPPLPRSYGLDFVGAILIVAASTLCACGAHRPDPIPEAIPPPEKARIEAAIASYEKHKENKEDTAPLSELRDSLRMLAKTWGNYVYARKELAKAAVILDRDAATAQIDLQVSQTQQADAEAQAARYSSQRWYFLAGGVVGGVLLAVLMGMAL